MMKRFMVLVVGLVFLFCTSAIAAEKKAPAAPATPATPAVKAEPAKAEAKEVKKAKTAKKKAAEMSTAGKVLEESDKGLKMERTLKGKAETMEFSLEKSLTDIKVGDQIKVSYLEKDGRNILIKVAPAKKTAEKKAKTAEKKAEKKAAAPAKK